MALFAPARELTSMSTAYAAATETWAMDAGCSQIDTEDTSEFFRVWLSCAMYGVCLITAISVPYYLCSNRKDKSFEEVDEEAIENLKKVLDAPENREHQDEETEGADARGYPLASSGEDIAPDFAKAKEHFHNTSPLVWDKSSPPRLKWRSVLGGEMGELSQIGGMGVELYFRLLRSMGLCFAYLSVFSLPAMVFSYKGNFVPDVGATGIIAKTTIGNLGQMASNGVSQVERLVIVGCQGMPLVNITKYFGWLDFFGVVAYMLFVAWYHFKFIPAARTADDDENITTKDFAVEINHLPSRISGQEQFVGDEYEKALEEHILKVIEKERKKDKNMKTVSAPKVGEVALARDFHEKLSHIKVVGLLKKERDISQAYGKEAFTYKYGCFGKVPLSDIIAKKEQQLEEDVGEEPQLEALRAYVLLNSVDDRQRLLNAYRFGNVRLLRSLQSKDLRFYGTAIRVKPAPEPTNILWENQDVPWKKRLCMRTVMFCLWVVVMLISTGLILATQVAAKEQGPKSGGTTFLGEAACDSGTKVPTDGYVCNAQMAMNWTIAHVQTNLTSSADAISCFCSSKGYKNILASSELRSDICHSWMLDSARTSLIAALASGITVVINIILQAMLMVFVQKEKHTSVSGLNSSLMFKVAVSQVVNTGFIIVCVNYDGLFWPFIGDYAGFERGWYGVVGQALCMNLCLNCVTPAAVKVLMVFVGRIRRLPCFTKRLKHQAQLLDAYTNPEFNIATRYAQILTTCFLTLIFSPGLPILNFFAVIYFFVNFWVDKWVLLHCSKRPPAYDVQMPTECTRMMLFAGPAHMLLAIAMYSHPCTFPSNPLGGAIAGLNNEAIAGLQSSANGTLSSSGASTASFSERVARESTWMMFTAFLITLAFFLLVVVKKIIGGTMGGLCSAVLARVPTRKPTAPVSPEAEASQEVTWDRCKNGIQNSRPPASYKMGNNRDYKQVARFLFESRDRPENQLLPSSASQAASRDAAQSVDMPAASSAPASVASPGQPGENVASPGQTAENVASAGQSAGNVEGDLTVRSADASK